MSQIELFSSARPETRYSVDEIGMYSDNTPFIKGNFPTDADSLLVRPDSMNAFVAAMALADGLEEQGWNFRNLYLPYVPGARQDRSNPDGDALFMAGYVAKMINILKFRNVVMLDPHSPVTPTLIRGSVEYPLELIYKNLWHGYGGVIAPDAGGVARATRAARTLNMDLVRAEKHRDVSTGALSGFSVNVEAGKHYIVIDDICDGGGTFVGLGEKIREQGAFADLFVTHGIFAKGVESLKKYYKNIYTTDSMEKTDGTLTIPVVERMLQWTR